VQEAPHLMTKPANVLLVVTSSDFGGTESFLLELTRGLDRRRFRPIVLSLRPCGRVASEIADLGVEVASLEMSSQPRLRELLSGVRDLATRIDELEVDLVHSLLYRANVVSAIAARLSRRRPRMVAGQRSVTPLGGAPARVAARWTRGLCDRIVAVSEAARRALIERERCDPDRILVIENGVDCGRFRPRDPGRARRTLGLEPDTLVVGAVTRLSPEKGVSDLIEAVARVDAGAAPLELLVVGDGPERDRLEAQARATGAGDRVRFLGQRVDVEELYPAFDIFVLASYEEGSPNVLLEAMASGCPVVATAVGGTPEILGDPPAGRLVEPGDPVGMTVALEDLLRDAELRRRLGKLARRCIEEKYDVGTMIRRHEELYASLLEGPVGSRASAS
jgi:L-malate glycosyltransferase